MKKALKTSKPTKITYFKFISSYMTLLPIHSTQEAKEYFIGLF